ncbi:MAG: cytochrome c5 family protein [Pseudomonadales bacterium]|nr:cytochrome c5 family protein [Pseudomonadales bacterium]
MRSLQRSSVAALMALSIVTGCSAPEPPAAHPVSADLQVKYAASCKSCHQVPATGAPQTHRLKDWQPRLNKGYQVLLDNTVNGIGGMPPLGQCFDCTTEELEELIRFMSGPAS